MLNCKGKILEPIKLNPQQVSFGQITREDIGEKKKVDITRGDASTLDLKLPARETPGFTAELRTIEPGERYELEITLLAPLPDKRIFQHLILETGFPQAPTASVRVYATIPPHVVARPSRIRVPMNRDSEWMQSVRLIWNDELPHKVLSASVTDPELSVKVAEEDGAPVVVLSVPKDYAPRPRGPFVTIRTDDAQTPVLRVPVYAIRPVRPQPARGSSRARQRDHTQISSKRTDTAKKVKSIPGAGESDAPEPKATKPDTSKPSPKSHGTKTTDNVKTPVVSSD